MHVDDKRKMSDCVVIAVKCCVVESWQASCQDGEHLLGMKCYEIISTAVKVTVVCHLLFLFVQCVASKAAALGRRGIYQRR